MTQKSVNANSRKCVTLQLDPCPLELDHEPNTCTSLFWCDFLNFNRIEEREFNKIDCFFFSLNICLYEDVSARLIKKFWVRCTLNLKSASFGMIRTTDYHSPIVWLVSRSLDSNDQETGDCNSCGPLSSLNNTTTNSTVMADLNVKLIDFAHLFTVTFLLRLRICHTSTFKS